MLEFLFAVGLAWVNIAANELEQWTLIPQSQWLPFANGVSITYMLLEILPELGRGSRRLEYDAWPVISYGDWILYLPVLLGITVFYGIEALAWRSPRSGFSRRQLPAKPKAGERGSAIVFWLHILVFAIYNGILGYLLWAVSTYQGFLDSLLFWVVLALQLLLNDANLSSHYRAVYQFRGRWIVALAVVLGTVTGIAIGQSPPEAVAAPTFLWAFISGSVLFISLTTAARHRNHSFWAFLTGATIYAILLLLIATP